MSTPQPNSRRSSRRVTKARFQEEHKHDDKNNNDNQLQGKPGVNDSTSSNHSTTTKTPRSRKNKTSTASSKGNDKMLQELDVLHQEMDLVAYSRTASGQLRRKIAKVESGARTRKRKLLEQMDANDMAIEHEDEVGTNEENANLRGQQRGRQPKQKRRLRGPKAAFDGDVIQGSHVFLQFPRRAGANMESTTPSQDPLDNNVTYSSQEEDIDDDEDDEEDEDEDNANDEDDAVEDVVLVEDSGISDVDADDDDDDENSKGNEEDDATDDPKLVAGELPDSDRKVIKSETDPDKSSPLQKVSKKVRRRKIGSSKESKRKRRMYRLKNFQSQRMAQRHGQALGAHARGQPRLAIELLKQVAKDAPSAPQIYSSLGMVYEDMLKESRKRSPADVAPTTPVQEKQPTIEESLPDPALAEQLDLAKKAYGSYHIAAILCKKDFTLWVRAADAGFEVAQIHGQAMMLPDISPEIVSYHRSERHRWHSEVVRDYRVADNLKPPGIDVPAKLAAMLMEVGSFSEALTILTDLKNQNIETHNPKRNEFQSSYKAWLLYADLMLRIGHECIQWNRGVQTNDNHMFRRWLRKYSHIFDWQRRRLQALCLALEAACGTRNTEKFIAWIKEHTATMATQPQGSEVDDVKPDGTNRWHSGVITHDKSPNQHESESDVLVLADNLETERQLLLKKNRAELEAFDKTTADMDLGAKSAALADDRQIDRGNLVKGHEEAVAALDKEPGPVDENEKSDASDSKDVMMGHFEEALPMSASCRQVCNIASELMKHLHGLELYAGARLVGESVSNYFKERASKYDKRVGALRRLDEWHKKVEKSPFLFQSYDEVEDDGSNSDINDDSPFLSDDEELDRDESAELLESLRKGVLPPELRVLFGLALIGEGGKNILAAKCLEAIDDLEQESRTWLSEGERETEKSGMPLWYLFRLAMTETLDRTAAYAFLADVLRKTKKEKEWSVHFAPRFRQLLSHMKENEIMEQLMGLRGDSSPFANFRKNQLLKIVLAACSFDVDIAVSPSLQSPVNRNVVETEEVERVSIAVDALKLLSEVFYLVWRVDPDGSLPATCLEVVKICAKCLSWLTTDAIGHLPYSRLYDVIEYTRNINTFFGGAAIPSFKERVNTRDLISHDWGEIPISASWQGVDYRPLSLRTYNLTVACNVSLFSGWEPDEFTLRLLRRRYGNKHFGVYMRPDRRVTGFLSKSMEEEISRQWHALYQLLPDFPDVGFDEKLRAVKQTDWYKNEVEDRKKMVQGTEIARYCEEEAETVMLAFSSLCLWMLHSEENISMKSRLLQVSLSILLPVSQFCMDERLWDSDIGEAASSLSGFDEWRLAAGIGLDGLASKPVSGTKPPRKRRSAKFIEKKVQEWIKGTDKPTLQSYVNLPAEEFSRVWFLESQEFSIEEKNSAQQCMMDVHTATKRLRSCYTQTATEKASLGLAAALLKLAGQPACTQPFLCLQQAAMFASQASKAGNNDTTFRDVLPDKRECTPLQALTILGRADCLHSVYFPNEAAYLCSFVALVCRLHRDRGEPDLEWNQRWKIVAICAFNVSVMIRTTVSTVLDKTMQKAFLSMWERDVVEELERGRSDGWAWKRSLYNGSSAILPPEMDDMGDIEGDEAYNSLDEHDEAEKNDQTDEEDEEEITNGSNEEDSSDGDESEHMKGNTPIRTSRKVSFVVPGHEQYTLGTNDAIKAEDAEDCTNEGSETGSEDNCGITMGYGYEGERETAIEIKDDKLRMYVDEETAKQPNFTIPILPVRPPPMPNFTLLSGSPDESDSSVSSELPNMNRNGENENEEEMSSDGSLGEVVMIAI